MPALNKPSPFIFIKSPLAASTIKLNSAFLSMVILVEISYPTRREIFKESYGNMNNESSVVALRSTNRTMPSLSITPGSDCGITIVNLVLSFTVNDPSTMGSSLVPFILIAVVSTILP